MKVVVGKRAYAMTPEKFKGLLKVASEQVPLGIYAVEKVKERYAELKNIPCKSVTQLKRQVRIWEQQGFKVYYNRGR